MSLSSNDRFNLVRDSRCHRFINIYLVWSLDAPWHNEMWQQVGRFLQVGFVIRSGSGKYINGRGDSGHCLESGFFISRVIETLRLACMY